MLGEAAQRCVNGDAPLTHVHISDAISATLA
jgi:hypothetical protein